MDGKVKKTGCLLLLCLVVVGGVSAFEGMTDRDGGPGEARLLVGIKEAPPFVIKSEMGYSGLSIVIWEAIAEQKGWDFTYVEKPDVPSLIAMLESYEIDITIYPMTITPERIRRIDFSQPFHISSLGVVLGQVPETFWSIVSKRLFNRYTLGMILGVVMLAMVAGLVFWIVEHRRNVAHIRGGLRGFFDTFWWSVVTMTTVGYGDQHPITTVGRFVAMTWMFISVVIIAIFTGFVAMNLTVYQLADDVEDIRDLDRMRTATVGGSSAEETLKGLAIDSRAVTGVQEGFDLILAGELDAILHDRPILLHYLEMDRYRRLVVEDRTFGQEYYAFGYPTGSPEIENINIEIISLLSDDDWERVLRAFDLQSY